MKKNILLPALITVVTVAGVGIWYLTQSKSQDKVTQDSSQTRDVSSAGTVEPNKDSATYKRFMNVTADDYDRIFIANMIAHHQGAVEMAEQAQQSASHPELKALAAAIITAQQSEIANMQSWQKAWGYPASSGPEMMDHSAMMMDDEMTMMSDTLDGLTGDAFDKAFLTAMIEHHQGALDMAGPGLTNAKHDEIKSLVSAILTTQTQEIKQMMEWQKDWAM